jgi:hypothetical protein
MIDYKKLASVAVGISYVGPLGGKQGIIVLSQRSLSTSAHP